MDAGLALVQFFHILGGAAWLGASVFASVVLLPFLFGQPIERQRDLVSRSNCRESSACLP
jgi:uncharacterized membrane protein